MGNVTLPTPVFVAGGALCLVAGYLIGTVGSPDTPERTTATVVSFNSGVSLLCLAGDAVSGEKGVDANGVLCGLWNHSAGVTLPHKGDHFRFVSQDTSGVAGAIPQSKVVLYGTVVR